MRLSNGDVLLAWPLELHVLTAGYYYSDGRLHRAIDLRTNQTGNTRKPVYAAEAGTVDQTQTWDGHTTKGMQSYGTMVRIRHADYAGSTLQTRYAHLSEFVVKNGQKVTEGQLIGYTGETGNISGAHLHFEVIWAGVRRNPLVWLDDDFTKSSDSVYTYRAGESAVKRPDKTTASTMQLIYLYDVENDKMMQVFNLCKSLGLDKMGRYDADYTDRNETAQNGVIGAVSNGDAMLIYHLCQSLGLVDGKRYISAYVSQ